MGKSSRFSIEATISMIDRMSGPMKRASASVTGFSRKMQNQLKRADISAQKINKSMNRVGGKAARAGLAGLAIGAGLVVRQFIQFDDAIFAASAKFKGLDISTKAGMKTMEQLRKTARKVGAETKFNAVEAAQGLDFLALAGFNATQAMAALPGVVSLATVANIDLATATDIATDTLGSFNLATDDAVQLQKNLIRVNDVLAKTTATSNTTLVDLFESVKKGGATFTGAGQSIESFSAFAGIMANAGVKGSESGTVLRNMMLNLSKPVGDANKLLKNMGVTIQDSQGNFKDVIDIIGDFEKGLSKMGSAQKTAAIQTVFGKRAATGMNILLKAGSDKLREYREELIKSGGAAKKMADVIEQSMGNKLRALGSALTDFGFSIITAFAKDGKKGIDAVTKSIRNMDPTPIVTGLKAIGKILGAVWVIVEGLAPFVDILVASFVTFKLAMIALTIATEIFGVAFNVAIWPITLIAIGIGLIILAVFRLIRMWDQLAATFEKDGFFSALAQFFGFGGTDINVNKKTTMEGGSSPGYADEGGTSPGYASPESPGIINENNTTSSGIIDVNFNNTPPGTGIKQSGKMAPGLTLNYGKEP